MLTREELETIRATIFQITAAGQENGKISVKKISADAVALLDEAIYLELELEEEKRAGAFNNPLRQAERRREVRARLNCQCPPTIKKWRASKNPGTRSAA